MNSSRGESSRTSQQAASASLSKWTPGRTLWVIFTVAVPVNYLWEMAQTPLYTGAGDVIRMMWLCFVASLGDGVLVLLIFVAGWVVFRRRDWFMRPDWRGYLLMATVGLVIAVGIELVALHVAGVWEYAESMPRVPLVGIGLAPLAQMMVLPPLIFRVAAWWLGRTSS